MPLRHKEGRTKPRSVTDPQTDKALRDIYKELNKLKESVKNFKFKEETDNAVGEEGDIRVVKSADLSSYSLQIRGDNEWLEDKTAKYVGLRSTVNVKKEQRKKTLPKAVGGLLPSPDYDSGWVALAHNSSIVLTHNLALSGNPRLIQHYKSTNINPELGTHNIYDGTYTWDNSGCMIVFTGANTMKVWSDNSAMAGAGAAFTHDSTPSLVQADGHIRVLLWK